MVLHNMFDLKVIFVDEGSYSLGFAVGGDPVLLEVMILPSILCGPAGSRLFLEDRGPTGREGAPKLPEGGNGREGWERALSVSEGAGRPPARHSRCVTPGW